MNSPDFRVENHGTIVLFAGQHEGARQWLRNTAPEDAQWFCGKLVVEPRYVQGVIDAAESDNYRVLVP